MFCCCCIGVVGNDSVENCRKNDMEELGGIKVPSSGEEEGEIVGE